MRAQLKDDNFDVLFHSPLQRADQTAQIIWGSRKGPVAILPSLREIDLYSFQVGLLQCCCFSTLPLLPEADCGHIRHAMHIFFRLRMLKKFSDELMMFI